MINKLMEWSGRLLMPLVLAGLTALYADIADRAAALAQRRHRVNGWADAALRNPEIQDDTMISTARDSVMTAFEATNAAADSTGLLLVASLFGYLIFANESRTFRGSVVAAILLMNIGILLSGPLY